MSRTAGHVRLLFHTHYNSPMASGARNFSVASLPRWCNITIFTFREHDCNAWLVCEAKASDAEHICFGIDVIAKASGKISTAWFLQLAIVRTARQANESE